MACVQSALDPCPNCNVTPFIIPVLPDSSFKLVVNKGCDGSERTYRVKPQTLQGLQSSFQYEQRLPEDRHSMLDLQNHASVIIATETGRVALANLGQLDSVNETQLNCLLGEMEAIRMSCSGVVTT